MSYTGWKFFISFDVSLGRPENSFDSLELRHSYPLTHGWSPTSQEFPMSRDKHVMSLLMNSIKSMDLNYDGQIGTPGQPPYYFWILQNKRKKRIDLHWLVLVINRLGKKYPEDWRVKSSCLLAHKFHIRRNLTIVIKWLIKSRWERLPGKWCTIQIHLSHKLNLKLVCSNFTDGFKDQIWIWICTSCRV